MADRAFLSTVRVTSKVRTLIQNTTNFVWNGGTGLWAPIRMRSTKKKIFKRKEKETPTCTQLKRSIQRPVLTAVQQEKKCP